MTLRTWVRTVSTDTPSCAPTSCAVPPSAMRCMISRSRGERFGSRDVGVLGQQHPIEAGVDVRAALRDPLDRREQLVDRPGLQRVAPRAGVQAVVEQVEVAVAGVEDHPELGRPLEQLPGEVDAAAVRELDVDDRDVRLGVIDDVEARGDVRGGSDDLHPALPEQHRETLAQGLVVVDDHQPGHRWARTYPLPGCRAQNTAKACVRAVQHAKNPPKSGGNRTAVVRRDLSLAGLMAKDTEKLIRQLSLISYLMAERRPVTALEIRRDVEGYSGMNEDAFARRFYADRSELESLGIQLTVDRPPDAVAEQENYSLRPEEFHLPAIAFTDGELAALGTALSLLDGEFAYAEPLRLALQQLSWGRPSPLSQPEQQPVALGITASAGGQELSQRLAKVETAIFRGKTILFDYYTMERDETGTRKVDPFHLLFQGGQFYLLGRAHDRDALRVFRLSRMRGKVAYATKAEHDFRRPTREEFDPREYASRAAWQFGETQGIAEVLVSERIAWQVSRHFGRFGEIRPGDDGSVVFATPYASARMVASWVLRLGEHVQVLGPPELEDEVAERVATLAVAPRRRRPGARRARRPARAARRRRGHGRPEPPRPGRHRDPPGALRAPRHARVRPHRGRPARRAARRRRAPGAPADLRPRAARGHRRPQRRQLRRRARTSSTPRSPRTGTSRSTPSPTRTTSRARRGCCPSRPRRSSPRSTSSASTCPRAR